MNILNICRLRGEKYVKNEEERSKLTFTDTYFTGGILKSYSVSGSFVRSVFIHTSYNNTSLSNQDYIHSKKKKIEKLYSSSSSKEEKTKVKS